jgi:hypothetical protein
MSPAQVSSPMMMQAAAMAAPVAAVASAPILYSTPAPVTHQASGTNGHAYPHNGANGANGHDVTDWRTPVHKPVAQENLQAGAVELF